jgi:hypothetical protein
MDVELSFDTPLAWLVSGALIAAHLDFMIFLAGLTLGVTKATLGKFSGHRVA